MRDKGSVGKDTNVNNELCEVYEVGSYIRMALMDGFKNIIGGVFF